MTPDQGPSHNFDEQTPEEQLQEVWDLIKELGDVSVRLQRAADAAVVALTASHK